MGARERKSRVPEEGTLTLMLSRVWIRTMRVSTLVWWGMFWVKQKHQPTSVSHQDQVSAPHTIKACGCRAWRCYCPYISPPDWSRRDTGWGGWRVKCDKNTEPLKVSSVPDFATRTFIYNFYMSYARFCNQQEEGILFSIQFVSPCLGWTKQAFHRHFFYQR